VSDVGIEPNGDLAARGGIDVHLHNVVHLYPSIEGDVVALRGVDLDVAAGEAVSLLGPSGAGKSTVLGLLAGNFAASAGQVLIGQEDIGRMSGERLARLRAEEVSLVVQGADRNLLPYATVEENVWFSQRGAGRRRRQITGRAARPDLLERFGLGHLANAVVGRLPAGDRQRVALAAGVAPSPRLLLADEPTSRLDPEARDDVIGVLLTICEGLGTTVVTVTHDPEVASRLGRTVTVRDGRVGTEGRQGVEYVVVGRDGLLQLPADVSDLLPPDSLVEVVREVDGVRLRRAKHGDDEGSAP
jgi:putative ABC transport system ATP-binding protein